MHIIKVLPIQNPCLTQALNDMVYEHVITNKQRFIFQLLMLFLLEHIMIAALRQG